MALAQLTALVCKQVCALHKAVPQIGQLKAALDRAARALCNFL